MTSKFSLSGYVLPTYNAIRTSCLQKKNAHVERLMEPIKTTEKEKGVSIVSDGWSDNQRRPLINFMRVIENGPMFLKAVNCEGEYKDKFHIANLIPEVIMEVGPQNVVQVITYNAPFARRQVYKYVVNCLLLSYVIAYSSMIIYVSNFNHAFSIRCDC